jgi:hypothetical protein
MQRNSSSSSTQQKLAAAAAAEGRAPSSGRFPAATGDGVYPLQGWQRFVLQVLAMQQQQQQLLQ